MIPKALFPSRRTRRNRITPEALWRSPFRSRGVVGWRLFGRVEGCLEIIVRLVFGIVNELDVVCSMICASVPWKVSLKSRKVHRVYLIFLVVGVLNLQIMLNFHY